MLSDGSGGSAPASATALLLLYGTAALRGGALVLLGAGLVTVPLCL